MPRRTGQLQSNKSILLVVEGDTEKLYFSQLKSYERMRNVNITPRKAKHSAISRIFEEAIKAAETHIYDVIYCIYDKDVLNTEKKPKNFESLFKEAKKRNQNCRLNAMF